jgi:hypothetical protein
VSSVVAVNLQCHGGELHPGNGLGPSGLQTSSVSPRSHAFLTEPNSISRGHVWPAQVGNATGTTAVQPPMCTPSMRGETRVLAQGPSTREDGLPRCQAARIRLDVRSKTHAGRNVSASARLNPLRSWPFLALPNGRGGGRGEPCPAMLSGRVPLMRHRSQPRHGSCHIPGHLRQVYHEFMY